MKCRKCSKEATYNAYTIFGDIPYCTYHANKSVRENIAVARITKITN